ncbi:MAG: response regulator [Ignavibacteria bacterium]|nr:response regulator [Ignavibacteria bacterium]
MVAEDTSATIRLFVQFYITFFTKTMLRAVIIDDERSGRTVLRQMLERFCKNVEVVATADSASAGKEVILQYEPNVVFLDIEMPVKNGFEMLKELRQKNFSVVFVTAHFQYIYQAMDLPNVVDYLLKPIGLKELKNAVQKVEIGKYT